MSAPRPFGWGIALSLAAALAVALALLYWPAAGFDYAGIDDEKQVRDSRLVASGLSLQGVRQALVSLETVVWIPLTTLSLQADASLWGVDPGAFHRTNILLFAVCMSLFLLLAWRMTGDLAVSAFAAALAGFHPLRVESVAWISERKDLLSLLFLLLALSCYLGFVRTRSPGWYAGTALLFALGLASKPTLAPFPLLLLALDLWPLRRGEGTPPSGRLRFPGALALEKAPLLLLGAAAALGAIFAFSGGAPGSTAGGQAQRALLSPFVYLGRTLWPAGLHLEYFLPTDMETRGGIILAALLAHAALFALLARLFPRFPYLLAGWCWYLAALLPVGGIVPTGAQWISDRFTLLPHLGLALASARGARDLARRLPPALFPAGAAAGAAVLLLALAAGTRSYLPFWKDPLTLLQRTVSLAPKDAKARRDLAVRLDMEGRSGEAALEFEKALALPSPPPVHAQFSHDFAVFLSRTGERKEAIALLLRAVAEAPGAVPPLALLGRLLVEEGRPAEAIPVLERLLSLTGDRGVIGPAHLHLGMAYLGTGQVGRALGHFEESLRLDPEDRANRLAYARLLLASGRPAKARMEFARVEADPGSSADEREEARAGVEETRKREEAR